MKMIVDIKNLGSNLYDDMMMCTGKDPYKVILKTTRISYYYIFLKLIIKVNKINFELQDC